MKTATYTLPAHWACYLINGDASGMDESEVAAVDKFTEDHCLLDALTCTDDEEFKHTHDASDYGVLACTCLDFTFPVKAGA